MKIAKEIAKEQELGGVAYLDDLYVCFDKDEAESIIAARLEPVKKALERAAHRFEYLHFGGVKECNGVDTVVASQDIRAALALFEDE